MMVDKGKDPVDEGWLDSLRVRKLLFTLLFVLGLVAVVLLVLPLFRSSSPPADGQVLSDAPVDALPLSEEEGPVAAQSETEGTEAEAGENLESPLNPIDQLLSDSFPVEETPPPTTPPPAVVPSASKLPVKAFWVQLGAYSSRGKAQESAELVKEEFDPGESLKIEEVVINKQNFYRLRLGPYLSKEEGERILQLVKRVDMFKESYMLNG